jgi:hypothetical protein
MTIVYLSTTMETTMNFENLSFPPYFAEYAGIVGLLLLWKMYGSKKVVLHLVSTVTAPSNLHSRRHLRHPAVLPVEIAWELNDAKGMTKNLSMQGCRMKSDATPLVRTYASLKLLAVVRWVLGEDLGVEFLSWPSSERKRLQHFLASFRNTATRSS